MSKPHHELRILQHFNPFEEFNTEEIDKYKAQFDKFDVNGDHVLDFMELKRMMEILGAPQTHVQLKDMIKEIDDDFDGTINFTEFLLIFKKARDGELSCDGGLLTLARMTSIDVSQAGVSGAKDFFEAKAKVLTDSNLARRASNASNVSIGSSHSKDSHHAKSHSAAIHSPSNNVSQQKDICANKDSASNQGDGNADNNNIDSAKEKEDSASEVSEPKEEPETEREPEVAEVAEGDADAE